MTTSNPSRYQHQFGGFRAKAPVIEASASPSLKAWGYFPVVVSVPAGKTLPLSVSPLTIKPTIHGTPDLGDGKTMCSLHRIYVVQNEILESPRRNKPNASG